MPSTEKLLSITHLKKYFPVKGNMFFRREQQYVRANEDITLDIFRGETLGLVGESGSGKSTLGRTVLQLYEQTAGTTMYYGRTPAEIAPAYVEYTLKNAARLIGEYKKKQRRAEVLTRLCDAAGESTAAELRQRRDLACARAQTAKTKLAALLGGFITLDDPDQGAALLLKKHLCEVRLAQLTREIKRLDAELERLDTELGARRRLARYRVRREQCRAEHAALLERQAAHADALEALRAAHRHDPAFAEFEGYLDEGIDLSRLKYSEMRLLRKDLQIIFQDPYSSLNPRMTVGQIIEEGLVTHGLFERGSKRTTPYILQIMRRCGLQDYMLHRYPHQFSGGQRQRISIARALAVEPKFVVCDECVSALDVSIQSQIINLLQQLKREGDLTYLFISHDLSVVRYVADRIGVMYLGEIVELGEAEAVFGDPRHPYTVALLSSVPSLDADGAGKKRIMLEGTLPSPIRPPSGCKFHTRCYMACDRCRRESPPLIEVSPGHFAACHFAEKKKQVQCGRDDTQ